MIFEHLCTNAKESETGIVNNLRDEIQAFESEIGDIPDKLQNGFLEP